MTSTARRRFVIAGAAGVVLLAALLLWPGATVSHLNEDIYSFLIAHGVPPTIHRGYIGFALNVVVFIVPVMLVALVVDRWPRWWWGVAAVLGSGTTELAQGLLLPGRVPSWKDVVANSIGAVIGVVLAYVALARMRDGGRAVHPTEPPVGGP